MPVAKADGEDIIIDQIINSLSAVDPTAALDMTSWLSSLDAALQGAANFDPSSLAGTMPDLLDPSSLAGATPDLLDPSSLAGTMPDVDSALSAASTSADPAALPAADPAASQSLASLYETYIYDPAQTWHQDWIAGTTFLGNLTVQWDNALNGFWGDIGGQGMLIGNGADGTTAEIRTAVPADCGSVTAARAGTVTWPVRPAAPAASPTTATAVRAARATKEVWAAPVATPPTASPVTAAMAVTPRQSALTAAPAVQAVTGTGFFFGKAVTEDSVGLVPSAPREETLPSRVRWAAPAAPAAGR